MRVSKIVCHRVLVLSACIVAGEVIRNLYQPFPGSFHLFLRSTGIEGLCVSAAGVSIYIVLRLTLSKMDVPEYAPLSLEALFHEVAGLDEDDDSHEDEYEVVDDDPEAYEASQLVFWPSWGT